MRFLVCYPFSDPKVLLEEGFAAYDGVLGDQPGAPHKGIDYVRRFNGRACTFDIFTMHGGEAWRGDSVTWGTFVILFLTRGSRRTPWRTIYAHLDWVRPEIPILAHPKKSPGLSLPANAILGRAGTTGATNGIVQLHIELHQKGLATGKVQKFDPYGVYNRASSGRYPQPGQSLSGLEHFWVTDTPSLAKG